MTKQYRMLVVYNNTENTLDIEKVWQHSEFAGFHIINININRPMGSKQTVEIYYESDIPFPFSYASQTYNYNVIKKFRNVYGTSFT